MRLFKDFTGISRRAAAANSSDRHRARPDSHRARRRYALGLERLEDRVELATFVATNLADSGDGSLRQAIEKSDITPGPNEIDFAPGLSGTITLTSGQLTITNNDVTIVGPGAGVLSVSGNHASRVFEVDSQDTEISGLTITAGSDGFQGIGGGVLNIGGLTLVACTISGCSAIAGGGVANGSFSPFQQRGTLTVTDSTISGNVGSNEGGGIANLGDSVTITDSTIVDNHASLSIAFSGVGGGIANFGSSVTITASTISGNSAKVGGGIFGGSTISGSTISGNTALLGSGGGIFGGGTITDSTISNNNANGTIDRYGARIPGDGGGIYSTGGSTLSGCTISGNTASDGGSSGRAGGGGIYTLGLKQA